MPSVHVSGDKMTLMSIIDTFNLKSGKWQRQILRSSPHPGVAYYNTAVIDNTAFFFGGSCGHTSCYYNTLTAFDMSKQKWKDVRIINPLSGPIKKYSAGMVPFKFKDHNGLFVIGGYGELAEERQHFSDYASSTSGPTSVRTNEQHMFVLRSCKWNSVQESRRHSACAC